MLCWMAAAHNDMIRFPWCLNRHAMPHEQVRSATVWAGSPKCLRLAKFLNRERGIFDEGCLGGRGSHVIQHHPFCLVGEIALNAVLQRRCCMAIHQRQHIQPCRKDNLRMKACIEAQEDGAIWRESRLITRNLYSQKEHFTRLPGGVWEMGESHDQQQEAGLRAMRTSRVV